MRLSVTLLLVVAPLALTYFAKSHTKCPGSATSLLSLLNLLCNATQVTVTTRDACYGCFFRAGSQPPGQTQVALLTQCATMYLTNTTYAPCIAALGRPSAPSVCFSGHCPFVQCLRRSNSAALVDECVTQAITVNPAFAATPAGRQALLGNATGCILARARCSQLNPITGALQTAGASATALQIAANGDLRIVAFAPNVATAELFCSPRTTLDQAAYQGALC